MVLWHQSEATTTKAAPLKYFQPIAVILVSRGEWPSTYSTSPDASFDSYSSTPKLYLLEMRRAARRSKSYYDVTVVYLRARDQHICSNLVDSLSAMALQFSCIE